MFIAPESAPTYLPPKSIQVTHEMGPLSSAAKLAAFRASMAQPASRIVVNSRNNSWR